MNSVLDVTVSGHHLEVKLLKSLMVSGLYRLLVTNMSRDYVIPATVFGEVRRVVKDLLDKSVHDPRYAGVGQANRDTVRKIIQEFLQAV